MKEKIRKNKYIQRVFYGSKKDLKNRYIWTCITITLTFILSSILLEITIHNSPRMIPSMIGVFFGLLAFFFLPNIQFQKKKKRHKLSKLDEEFLREQEQA